MKVSRHSSTTHKAWFRLCLPSIALLALVIISFNGCGGCRGKKSQPTVNADEDESQEGDSEEEIPPFEHQDLAIQPSVRVENAPSIPYVKEGHWFTANKAIIANEFDFQGTLDSSCLTVAGDEIADDNTQSVLVTRRSVPLAQGQWRDNEIQLYVPKRAGQSMSVQFQHELRARNSSRPVFVGSQNARILEDYQYLFVVLADNPTDYSFLNAIDAIRYRRNTLPSRGAGDESISYRVVNPVIDNRVPMPSQSLAWTCIAYLIWDNPDIGKFTRDQQDALIDWLHFGGQLIVSGPNSMTRLEDSFLADYLPAVAERSVDLKAEQFRDLNEVWSIQDVGRNNRSYGLELSNQTSVLGLELELSPDARFIDGTGELVAEKSVGRGRVLITAFPLDDPTILRWKSLGGFFSSVIMRRPVREFSLNQLGDVEHKWLTKEASAETPEYGTNLRYLSRDVSSVRNPDWAEPTEQTITNPNEIRRLVSEKSLQDRFFGGYDAATRAGMAGWNDSSGIAIAARQALEESAGITPPTSRFVLTALLVYLIVIVPVNWLVFRIIGKVELAWVAAPIIAIVGAVVVIRTASLDIGFVRSRTEIGVLEIHGGYDRAHLTRYTAVYSSLSTDYEFEFEDDDAQSLPFSMRRSSRSDQLGLVEKVVFERDRATRLSDLQVDSASVRMVHSEQMYQLDGTIELDSRDGSQTYRLTNNTGLAIHDVGILHRSEEGLLYGCWVGDLDASGAPVPITLQSLAGKLPRFDAWNRNLTLVSPERQAEQMLREHDKDGDNQLSFEELAAEEDFMQFVNDVDSRSAMARQLEDDDTANDGHLTIDELELACRLSRNGAINIGRMIDLASMQVAIRPGETRLIGWTDQALDQMQISPRASQTIQTTMVVVHLTPAIPITPQKETSSLFHFVDGVIDDIGDPIEPINNSNSQ